MPTNDQITMAFLDLLAKELKSKGFTDEQIVRAGFGLTITDNTGDGFIGATVTQDMDKGLPEMKVGFRIHKDGSVVPDKDLNIGGLTDAGNRGLLPIPTFFDTLVMTMEEYYGKPGAVR